MFTYIVYAPMYLSSRRFLGHALRQIRRRLKTINTHFGDGVVMELWTLVDCDLETRPSHCHIIFKTQALSVYHEGRAPELLVVFILVSNRPMFAAEVTRVEIEFKRPTQNNCIIVCCFEAGLIRVKFTSLPPDRVAYVVQYVASPSNLPVIVVHVVPDSPLR